MNEVIVIQAGSRAFTELAEAFADSDTYRVSLSLREDGLAIKVNEFMWGVGLPTGLCEFPPGCTKVAAPGKRLCNQHYDALFALLGPLREGDR